MRYVDLLSLKKRRKDLPKRKVLISIVAVLAIVGIAISFGKLLKPISVLSQISGGSALKSADGRINVLVLGLDKRAPQYLQTGILTDTIMLVSIGNGVVNNDVRIISVPRDLWVKISDGRFSKINEVYAYGGVGAVSRVVSEVVGVPVHYYVVVGFDGFTEFIDALGGIEVVVENTLDDPNYPIMGRELDTCGLDLEAMSEEDRNRESTYYCRYEHLHFDKGVHTFDGKTALKYARSRHGYNGEGNDFARARRQQRVVVAVKNKLLSAGILANPVKIKELYNIYKKYVSTDIGIGEVDKFYAISKDLNLKDIKTAVLDNKSGGRGNGLLFIPQNSSLYGGKSVLIPTSGDFSQIHSFVQKFLFAD